MGCPSITCPKCQRVWPEVSEQGVSVKLHEQCFACYTGGITEMLEPLRAEADYIIQNCSCFGANPECPMCTGLGWLVYPK